jgi:glycosyltransferase involved in cell wall biosynthesis
MGTFPYLVPVLEKKKESMSNKKLVMLVSNDLATDQRVLKLADYWMKRGYQVTLLGRRFKHSPEVRTKAEVKRYAMWFSKGPFFYLELNLLLFWFLLRRKTEVVWANDLDTLPAAVLANRFNRYFLIYDSHEWFTEVPELVARPKVQGFWLGLESCFLPKAHAFVTVNHSLAKHYSTRYAKPFLVLRNLPLANASLHDAPVFQSPYKLIYQGVLNRDRGLEELLEAIATRSDCTLYLIGTGDIQSVLHHRIAMPDLHDKVVLMGRMQPEDLRQLTPTMHLGFSLEKAVGKNYTYALPNKLFDYLQAAVPAVYAPNPEMQAFVSEIGFGVPVESISPEEINKAIDQLLHNPQRWLQLRHAALQARANYSFEKECAVLDHLPAMRHD